MRALLLLTALTLGGSASAQPKEEPVPEGVFRLAEIRAFVSSPLWFAWKLPSSKLLLGYARGPEGRGPEAGQLVVLDGKGRLDAKQTQAVQEALQQADASGRCMEVGERKMPLLMPLGTQGVVLQSSADPQGSCLFTWNARRSTIEVRAADSVTALCGPSGCPPKACWLTEDCWLPEAPDLDTARKGFHPTSLAQSLMEDVPAPGRAVLAATLPGAGRVLIWVPSWRRADAADSEKGMDSRLYVFDPQKKAIDTAMTRKLVAALGTALDECQGLGTVAELQQSGKGVEIRQFYAPGTTHLNCSSTVSWKGGKFSVEGNPSGDSSLGALEREQEPGASDDQALGLWKSGKRNLALAMWEQLYARADYQSPGFADVCNNLGFAYWTLSEFKKAEEVLLDCEKSFPARATIQLNLGDVYRDTGRAKEAMERYQHFLEMEGGTPQQRKAAEKSLERLKGRP